MNSCLLFNVDVIITIPIIYWIACTYMYVIISNVFKFAPGDVSMYTIPCGSSIIQEVSAYRRKESIGIP